MNLKLVFLAGILIFVGLAGCKPAAPVESNIDPTPTPEATTAMTTPAVTLEPACAQEDAPDFSQYQTWKKINPEPIKGHEVDVDIYVNDLAEEIYLSASGETFPVCAMIVKPHLYAADLETVTAVTVMAKMPVGYDPEHNDWWWGMYDGKGVNALMKGKVEACIACHLPVAADDYVFSKQVMAEIEGP